MGSPATFLAQWLQLSGIAYVVSTACTSSGKALVSAARLLQAGLCDVVLAGGVDSLCRLTLNGFNALESISPALTNPFSRNRNGINIGEGAAVFIVSREPGPVALLGYGESSDAYHLSAPEPNGRGAEQAMRAALAMARLAPEQIGYVNLHGTATPKNDEMESHATWRVVGAGVPVSSTKPLVGHTLGAAAATELGFAWLLLNQDDPSPQLPPHRWDGERDPVLAELTLVAPGMMLDPGRHRILSSSFAFGGNNVCLLIGAA
jgi:3-oxoacyl-[acyl-carrier-protein] synthase-1